MFENQQSRNRGAESVEQDGVVRPGSDRSSQQIKVASNKLHSAQIAKSYRDINLHADEHVQPEGTGLGSEAPGNPGGSFLSETS